MKKRKILNSIIALTLSIVMVFGGGVSAAAIGAADILIGMLGGGNGAGSVNVTELLAEFIKDQANDESIIDKFVENIKNKFNGTTPEPEPGDDEEVIAVIDNAEASIAADLFNTTVNELKKGAPGFYKVEKASLGLKASSDLQGFLPTINAMVASLIGSTDLAASIISGINGTNEIRTKYPAGNNVVDNIPVSGKEYVACLKGEDIKDYSVTVYKSGAYRMHIDLKDAEGASSQTHLAHVFDTSDKEFATLNLGKLGVNVGIRFKYVNNYVEFEVNRKGEISYYTQNMGITFMFRQDDGSYSTVMPYLGFDAEKEEFIYNIMTDISSINNSLRKMGDSDNDGKVNAADARNILRMSLSLVSYNDTDKLYCDVDGDGKLTVKDARSVLRSSVSLETLPSTSEMLGIEEYKRDEVTQNHINDLLIIISAYYKVKTEREQQLLEDQYKDILQGGQSGDDDKNPGGELSNTGDKIVDIIGGIGGLIGGLFGK